MANTVQGPANIVKGSPVERKMEIVEKNKGKKGKISGKKQEKKRGKG